MTNNQLTYQRNLETKRNNLELERQGRESLAYRGKELDETIRSHLANENITQSHYERMDAETNRHNLASENLGWAQVAVAQGQLAESQRHNRATELQSAWSNPTTLAGVLAYGDLETATAAGNALGRKAIDTVKSAAYSLGVQAKQLPSGRNAYGWQSPVTSIDYSAMGDAIKRADIYTATSQRIGIS